MIGKFIKSIYIVALSGILMFTVSCADINGAQINEPDVTSTIDKDTTLLENEIRVLNQRVSRLESIFIGAVNDNDRYDASEFIAIQIGVIEMLADSETGTLLQTGIEVSDLDDVRTTDTKQLILSDYIKDLNFDGTVKSGCTYIFNTDGTVVQIRPLGFTDKDYEKELHNIQTAVMAMLADSTTGALCPVTIATADMDIVQTTDTTPLFLSNYLTGLNADGTVISGCTYRFTATGSVTQTKP